MARVRGAIYTSNVGSSMIAKTKDGNNLLFQSDVHWSKEKVRAESSSVRRSRRLSRSTV